MGCSACNRILKALEKDESNSPWDMLPAIAILAIIPASAIIIHILNTYESSNA